MKKILTGILLIGICLPTAKAQENAGIKFEKDLNWDQVRQKAKAEHKYIFVDCYATWCGPCKQMDADVYPLKAVGDVYNREFICYRVQMDKTATDDEEVKKRYNDALLLGRNYAVTAYPTFLFFSPDGRPVHKVAGSRNSSDFIQLAVDAKDPQKQYYEILNNFQPGKIDTADLKGLAYSFLGSDSTLAGKLAKDYLERIPLKQVGLKDNERLIYYLQDDPQVLAVAVKYINSLDDENFVKQENARFIKDLSDQPLVHELAIAHISKLGKTEIGNSTSLDFIAFFQNDPKVQEIAKNYIDQLPEQQLYTKNNLQFIANFTQTVDDRGFTIFYHHPAEVNTVMKNPDYAQSMSEYVINKSEFVPLLTSAKEKGVEPDWETIRSNIIKKYNTMLADRIVTNGKVSWFKYLVTTKKEDKYWPQFNDAKIAQVKLSGHDTSVLKSGLINNIAYIDLFLHSNDVSQLQTALKWMKIVIDRNQLDDPDYAGYIDTYACLLYKTGNTTEALKWEQKALKIATVTKNKPNIELIPKTIAKMQKREQIWLEKEYQY